VLLRAFPRDGAWAGDRPAGGVSRPEGVSSAALAVGSKSVNWAPCGTGEAKGFECIRSSGINKRLLFWAPLPVGSGEVSELSMGPCKWVGAE